MIKALLKKQFLTLTAFLLQGKNGQRRSPRAIIGFSLLMAYALGTFCYLFYTLSEGLCAPLVGQGLSWLYFAFMGTIAMAFGVMGSVFMAKTSLYEAKDNDLLLSMPIPSWAILFSRTVGLYIYTLFFEALAFVPSVVCYFVFAGVSVAPLIGCALTVLLMPLGTLAICMLLGWLFAIVDAKLPVKNLLTTIFAVAFIVVYFILYSKVNEYLAYVIANGGAVAGKMQTLLYPFAKLGQGCAGNFGAMGIFVLCYVGAFALVYLVITKTYIRLVTANRGSRRPKYKSKAGKQGHATVALLKKEFFRYFKNPLIVMNCFLGTIMLVLLPFIALFNREFFIDLLSHPSFAEALPLLLAALLCLLCAMNMISAASVSLEGESLWIVRSLPVKTEKILFVKGAFHFLSLSVADLFATVFLGILLKVNVWLCGCILLTTLAFIAVLSLAGLFINLKLPNMHWTNEVAVVKQSVSTLVGMFSGAGGIAVLVGGWFLFGKYLPAWGYMLVCCGILAVLGGALAVWLKKRGTKIFESL